MPAPTEGAEIVTRLAERSRLREGAEGVRAVLRAIRAARPATTHAVARAARLPIPVVAALRREMEQFGLLQRGRGMELTVAGRALAESLGLGAPWEATCSSCDGRRIVLSRERRALALDLRRRWGTLPPADVTLDQAHSLPESAMRRALYMAESGALDGRAILCLGDDDGISLALGLLLRSRAETPAARPRLTVVDCDRRLLEWIAETAAALDVIVECVAHDLREQLPAALCGAFDVFETDPPYTPQGLRLFLSRAIEALRPGMALGGFVSFAHRPPAEQQAVVRTLVAAGFAIDEILPNFNEYEGAGILANRSQLLRVSCAGALTPPLRGRYAGPLYTADRRQRTKGGIA
jgi:predicted methyltransferase